MILLIFSVLISLNGSNFIQGKGIVKKGNDAYLTGGLKYGYAVYEFDIPSYVDRIKAHLETEKISGQGLDIMLLNVRGKTHTKKLNPKWKDNWVLWESTDNQDWASSRPAYVPVYQFCKDGKVKIVVFADGGFFRRDRYTIKKISLEYNAIPDSIIKIVEQDPDLEFNSGMLVARGVGFAKKGIEPSTKRAMAIRAAKSVALEKISKVFGKRFIPHPIVLSDTISEEGKAEVLIAVPINYFIGNGNAK